MADIHNAKQRMPAILAAEQIDAWLSGSADDARGALYLLLAAAGFTPLLARRELQKQAIFVS